MIVKDVFDFGWIDILATGHDHVFITVLDIHIAIGVLISSVARAKPAIGRHGRGGFVGFSPISLHEDVRAEADFADLTRRHGITRRRIRQYHLNPRQRTTA